MIKMTGKGARPKMTGEGARPKMTGEGARPKMTGEGARPKEKQIKQQKKSTNTKCKQCNTGTGISFLFLKKLLGDKPVNILLNLTSCSKCLVDLINEPMKFNKLYLFLKILEKSQQCSLEECSKQLLLRLSQSKFLKNVCTVIEVFDISDQSSVDCFIILVNILKSIITHNPNEYRNIMQIMPLLKIILHEFSKMNHQSFGELQQNFLKLEMLNQTAHRQQKPTEKLKIMTSLDRPENFRDIPLILTSEDLDSNTIPFLRKNKINGRYDNIEEYLDTQFRLLREDFIAPLREGIHEYKSRVGKDKRKKIDNIYIYSNVHISSTLISMNGILYELMFDICKIDWSESKRLIHGSLVCLSCDDFKTIYFATVAERNLKLLAKGKTQVKFLSSPSEISALPFDATFVMIETVAFFEAYQHVLHGMQQLSATTMPFQEYIVCGQKEVKPPKYFTKDTDITIDLTCLKNNSKLSYDRRSKPLCVKKNETKIILDPQHHKWPTAKELDLNNSQCSALCNALTKEFSLIQGPPGTGKTFLGLKIIKVLCANSHIWKSERNSPILVVCYTNHALDQFLEGVDKFLDGRIVRVGGRSKSDILEKYFLHNVKKKRSSYIFQENKRNIEKELLHKMSAIQSLYSLLKNRQNITDEHTLETYMQHFYFWLGKCFQRTKSNSRLRQWLQYGFDPENHEESLDIIEEEKEPEYVDFETEIDILENERKLQHEFCYNSSLQMKERKQLYQTYILSTQDFKLWNPRKKVQKNMENKLFSGKEMSLEESEKLTFDDFQEMELSRRWCLYQRWLVAYKNAIHEKCVEMETKFSEDLKVLNELKAEEHKEILRDALVVGMTTTCAARLQPILQDISPQIILVEEAAHVLESHIITSLNPFCEHLILIGDHQQLQPSPQVYQLAREYKLNVSLFERMVNNHLDVSCLSLQHRMRPEIAQLIHPIYKDLENHDSVKEYENIKGINTNIFFLHHEVFEDDAVGLSHSNEHEALFIVELYKYLIKQNYSPSQITILTTYSAQLFKVKKLLAKQNHKVLVKNIDNYQGEENDIILLTLVRSNASKNVGFLKVQNRVCVALSRAKKGFYVIGNFEILAKSSQIWQMITTMLVKNNKLGSSLPLRCQIHTDTIVNVSSVKDFDSVPEGGCLIKCDTRLECGHTCSLYCHPYDQDHKEYKCKKDCTKIPKDCPLQHKCVRRCYERCTPCLIKMIKVVPGCQHNQEMKCSDDPVEFCCQMLCQKTLPCGHLCRGLCGECFINKIHPPCMQKCENVNSCGHNCPLRCSETCEPCQVKVKKIVPSCQHTQEMKCSDDPVEFCCQEFCQEMLPCGHLCRDLCGKCFINKIHLLCMQKCENVNSCGHNCPLCCYETCEPCQVKVKKIVPSCQHTQEMKCSDDPVEFFCQKFCQEMLACGHLCRGLCGKCFINTRHPPCMQKCENINSCGHNCPLRCYETCEPCQVKVKKIVAKCQHTQKMKCSDDPVEFSCWELCQEMLPCGHLCRDLCGKCFINTRHPPCMQKCENINSCGHNCPLRCSETCEPCQVKVKKIVPRCQHTQEMKCSDDPVEFSCQEFCQEMLACGRLCRGLCGKCFINTRHPPCKQKSKISVAQFSQLIKLYQAANTLKK